MTKGPIMKLVVLFALPICAGNILQQLYSTVDALVIGNFCGSVSLAAVGTTAQPIEMLLCIFMGLGTGVSILVSQYFGNHDTENLNEIIATSVSFLYLSAIPLSILGIFLGPLLLKIMLVPADAWDHAVSYIRIVLLGTLGNMGYNMNAGILRGLGDSSSSLLFLFISCLINIVLDVAFVAFLGMDVPGAALATSLAMFASWLFSIVYIKRKYPELGFTLLPRRLNRSMLAAVMAIGLPLGINNSFYSVGHMVLQSLINTQGSSFMAACTVASKVSGFANIAISSFSSAATTFAGQNLGAHNYIRLQKGVKQIPFFSGLATAVFGLIVSICCRPLLGFFTKDAFVLEMAVQYIWLTLPPTWLFSVFNGLICYVNGLGEVRYPTVINLLMLWAVRIPVAYLLAAVVGSPYLMLCYPISFLFGLTCMLMYFRTKRWKEIRQLAAKQAAENPGGT